MNSNDLFKAAMEINLDQIKAKLMHVESGEGWSREKADAVEKEYRRFLCLMKLYPNEPTAPLNDVDTFWHYHILDTMKYAEDCAQLFGYFLHHYPYVGMRGDGDEQVRVDSGERMKTLYENTFGEPYPVAAMAGDGAATAWCGGPWPDKFGFTIAGIRIKAATAWCGGPWPDKAGPAVAAKPASVGAATAWCGGPWPDKAGPAISLKPATIATASAWCGGPWPDKAGPALAKSAKSATAATLDTATAWCGGPWPDKAGPAAEASGDAVKAATAWCGGPWPDKAGKHAEPAGTSAKQAHHAH